MHAKGKIAQYPKCRKKQTESDVDDGQVIEKVFCAQAVEEKSDGERLSDDGKASDDEHA